MALETNCLHPNVSLEYFGGNESLMERKGLQELGAQIPGNFEKCGGFFNNLWPGAVLGPGACWPLVMKKRGKRVPDCNQSRTTLEALDIPIDISVVD